MEGNKSSKPRGLLVFGAPCSGKTTFAEKFAKKFGLAYYNLAELMDEHGFSFAQILVLLEQVLKTRQTVVIEGCLDTEKSRIEIRNLFRKNKYEPALIWIQTDVATIRSRLKSKYGGVGKAKKVYDEAFAKIEAPADIEFPIILSGKHTFETQSKHVVAGLAESVNRK